MTRGSRTEVRWDNNRTPFDAVNPTDTMTVTPHTRAQVADLLGRDPVGLQAIAVAAPDGRPVVIRVASLVGGKPFPTLFWLVDPELIYRIDQAEASGLIHRFQARLDADPELRARIVADHEAHIALRSSYLTQSCRDQIAEQGFSAAPERRGIGGIGNYRRIRCLHTWYAAHLVVPNTIGEMLDDWWREGTASGDC